MFNANIEDRDRHHYLRQVIWVCTVCQLPIGDFPTKIGLGESIHFQGRQLSLSLYLPSEKESNLRGKTILPRTESSSALGVDPLQKEINVQKSKQTGSQKCFLSCKTYEIFPESQFHLI